MNCDIGYGSGKPLHIILIADVIIIGKLSTGGLSEKCKQTASKNCQNKFCLQTGKEEKACLDLDAAVCKSTHDESSPYKVCSVSGASESNLCVALSKNTPMHYTSMGGAASYCDKTRLLEIRSKDDKPIAMNEYVKVTRTTNEFNAVCGSAFVNGKIKCKLHNHNGENLKTDFDTPCNKPFSVSDAELKKRGSLRVTCFVKSGDMISKTFFKIIYLDAQQLFLDRNSKFTVLE
uniref:Uncharacterized protein n=1 Tax=Romanomermis culicivorax TaxID=13658 RepID=A0A915JRF0_ROMCU